MSCRRPGDVKHRRGSAFTKQATRITDTDALYCSRIMMNFCEHWISIFVALLGPFQFGLGLAMMNTMLDSVSSELSFNKNIGGAVATGAIYLGCTVGSFLSGPTLHFFGRCSQLVMATLFLMGSILCGLSPQSHLCWGGPLNGCVPTMLLCGRLLIGLASGLAVVISPKYLADVAVPRQRMSLCTVLEIFIVAGVLFGLVIGLPYEFDSFDIGYDWWRIMFLSGCVPAVVQFSLHSISLLKQVRSAPTSIGSQSTQVADFHTRNGCQSSSNGAQEDLESSVHHPGLDRVPARIALRTLLETRYRRSVILGLGVPFVCQLSGSLVIDSYSTTIFEDAGFSRPIIGSILYGITNLICTIITAIVIGRFKRRNIAFFSFIGMGVCFLGVALADLSGESVRGVLSVVFVLVFVMFYSAGCGPLSTAYAPEVVPPSIAGTVLGLGQSLGRFTNLLLVLFFPSFLDNCGAFIAFCVLTSFAFGSYLFLKAFMVETNGKSLVEIFRELEQ